MNRRAKVLLDSANQFSLGKLPSESSKVAFELLSCRIF